MNFPRRSSHSSNVSLHRWNPRFLLLQKPMFWVASSVLTLVGFMIVDYFSFRSRQEAIAPTQLITEQARLSSPLNNTPFADDPELREWVATQGRDLLKADDSTIKNGSNEESTLSNISDNTTVANSINRKTTDNVSSIDVVFSNEFSNLTNNLDKENAASTTLIDTASLAENLLNPLSQDNVAQLTREENTISSSFPNLNTSVGIDDTLSSLRSTVSIPQLSDVSSTPKTFSSPLLTEGFSPDFTGSRSDALPPSALSEALDALSATDSASSDLVSSSSRPLRESSDPVNSKPDKVNAPQTFYESLPHTALPLPSTQGLTVQELRSVQTSPPPGTTGYTVPAPLPNRNYSHLDGSSGLSTLVVPTNSNASSATLDLQPSLNRIPAVLPQQPTVHFSPAQLPFPAASPVFPPTVEQEYVPYTGGGRNGRINTFSNP